MQKTYDKADRQLWGGGTKGWKEEMTKGQKGTLGGDRRVQNLDCSDGFMGIYLCQNYHIKK